MKVKTLLTYWLPVFLWMSMIFGLSSMPTLPGPEIIWWDFAFKKSAHMFVFGVLFFLLQRGLRQSGVPKTRAIVLAIIFTVMYGISDEIHQSFVPGRSSRVMDVGFDTVGTLIAFFILEKKEKEAR